MDPEAKSEILKLGEKHPDWALFYESVSKSMETQAEELKALYHRILLMRYETAKVGLECIQAKKHLESDK